MYVCVIICLLNVPLFSSDFNDLKKFHSLHSNDGQHDISTMKYYEKTNPKYTSFSRYGDVIYFMGERIFSFNIKSSPPYKIFIRQLFIVHTSFSRCVHVWLLRLYVQRCLQFFSYWSNVSFSLKLQQQVRWFFCCVKSNTLYISIFCIH